MGFTNIYICKSRVEITHMLMGISLNLMGFTNIYSLQVSSRNYSHAHGNTLKSHGFYKYIVCKSRVEITHMLMGVSLNLMDFSNIYSLQVSSRNYSHVHENILNLMGFTNIYICKSRVEITHMLMGISLNLMGFTNIYSLQVSSRNYSHAHGNILKSHGFYRYIQFASLE